MAQFVIRIQLNESPADAVYYTLDEAMKRSGFLTYIDAGGDKYQLPHGEYVGASNQTRSQVLEVVRRAVQSAWGKSYDLLVTEGTCIFDLPIIEH